MSVARRSRLTRKQSRGSDEPEEEHHANVDTHVAQHGHFTPVVELAIALAEVVQQRTRTGGGSLQDGEDRIHRSDTDVEGDGMEATTIEVQLDSRRINYFTPCAYRVTQPTLSLYYPLASTI